MKSFIASAIFASAAVAAPTARRQAPSITDVDILNYALTLEHLENTFYREGLANFTQEDFAHAGFDSTFYHNLKEIAYDEKTHVSFLTTALEGVGAKPVAECTYAFGVTDPATFVATSGILEGVGVSAYLGAAASIVEDAYLTAAGSILTVESRHSAYIRAAQHQSPFPQAFDAPLDFNQVYTLAAPFFVQCPETNGPLPVKAFPTLAATPAAGDCISSGSSIFLTTPATPKEGVHYFAAWAAVTGFVFVPATWAGGKFETEVPAGFHGQSYVVIVSEQKVSDETTLAGPAIVEITGTQGKP